MTEPSPAAAKAEVRRRLRTARRQLTAEDLRSRGEQLAEVLTALIPADAVLAGFLPIPGEPDLLPFLHRHISRGGVVYLPVIADAENRLMQWTAWSPETPLQPSPFAPVSEPAGPRISTEELIGGKLTVLVPALAVDTSGARLGQGGGYYDTLFQQNPKLATRAQLLAVVHSWEVLSPGSFPVETHDLRIQQAVTETGVLPLG